MEKSTNLNKFVFIGVLVLLGIFIFNSFFLFDIGKSLGTKIDKAQELAKPAKIEIIKLESSCLDCFDTDEVVDTLKESGLEIINEKLLTRNSQEALELINKYSITKLPTVVLKGEIEKASAQNFKEVGDALVFDGIVPPYEDAITKKIMGKVSSIIINDANCDVCVDFNLAILNLKQNGVFIANEEELDFSEARAKELIDEFGIEKLPTVLLSDDIDAYTSIAQSIEQTAAKKEGYYIVESQAPYVETESGKIRGLVTLTMLNDSACPECYDVSAHKSILARFGIAVDKEEAIDIKSDKGKQLILKYSLINIPTVIISGDLDVYTGFKTVWSQVGTVENDGAYIFRKIEAMGKGIVYKDISTNEIKNMELLPQQ